MVAVSRRMTSSNGRDETTLTLRTGTSIASISLAPVLWFGNRCEKSLRASLSPWLGVHSAFVDMRGAGAVDQETEQFGPAVVAARVHQLLALVDQREVEVGDDDAFARMERLAQQRSVRGHDRGEAAAGD